MANLFVPVSEIRMRLRSIDHGCLLDHRGASYLSHCLTACLPVPDSRTAVSKRGVTTVYQRKYSSNFSHGPYTLPVFANS